jgi:Ca2+-binding RTX toxin-like protein
MGTKNLGNGNDKFAAYKEGGFLGIGKEWRSWTINGNGGNDTLTGGEKSDTIHGNAGNDVIRGNKGLDYLFGDAGNDFIDGDYYDGKDYLYGGTENDTYWVGVDDSVIEYANQGYDTVVVMNSGSVTSYSMPNNVENLHLNFNIKNAYGNSLDNFINAAYTTIRPGYFTINSLDNAIEGYGGNDIIFGGDGNDTLGGGNDNDFLAGDNGNDRLYGDAGNDNLVGAQYANYVAGDRVLQSNAKFGTGERDTLTGGAGNDTFWLGMSNAVFYDDGTASSGQFDYALITDFTIGQDKIQLNGIASSYKLVTSSFSGAGSSAQDTLIYRLKSGGQFDELIGVVQDVTGLNLNSSSQFIYA